MGLELGNLLGAAANLTTAFSKEKNLKTFLQRIDDFGIQVANNFEVNLFGLEDVTFFVQSVNFGGLSQHFEEIHYNGRSIPIPTYIDYEHDGTMTVLNDANGYIYAAISNYINSDSSRMVDNGIVMTIKCLTGDKHYKGAVVTLKSVRLEKIEGLQFGYEDNGILKFNVNFRYLDFSFTPGALGKVAGVTGAVNSLIS